MITMGIDSGSLSTKGVVLGPEREILSDVIELTGGVSRDSGERVRGRLLDQAGLSEQEIDFVVSTGYGRENLSFSNKDVTEIACHGAGVHFLFPDVSTILDIGRQDSKAIRIDENGNVTDFVMNDKCAAIIARKILGKKRRRGGNRWVGLEVYSRWVLKSGTVSGVANPRRA